MNRKKIRNILIVTSEFPPLPGGLGKHAYHLSTFLVKLGYKIVVITDQRTNYKFEESEFDKNLNFKVRRVSLMRIRLVMYFRRLVLFIENIVHSDMVFASGKFSLWATAFLSFFFKRKYVAIIHGTEVNFKSSLLKKTIDFSLLRFDTVVAVSNYTKSLVNHLNHTDLRVITNGLDFSEFINNSKINLVGSPKLLTVGRVSDRKGQKRVINFLPKLKLYFPDIHYHCVGMDNNKKECLKIAKRLGVSNALSFHGRIDSDSLGDYYNSSDIFIMLSKETMQGDVEGFGIALLEANLMGLPTIGSDSMGIKDAIDPGVSGELVHFNEFNQVRDAIEKIINNKEHYVDGATKWASKHNWEYIIRQYEEIIDN